MNVFEEAYAKGYEIGYAEGVRIQTVKTIRNLAQKNISMPITAEILDVTEEYVKGVLAATATGIK